MIITLIGLGLIIVGIIFAIIYDNVHIKNWKIRDMVDILKFISILLGVMLTLLASVLILVNISTCDVYYQNTLHEREMLEYRIDHVKEDITGNEMLYNDIVEFNNGLRIQKKWANNPWTNWFSNQNIASIDYIELDE